MRPHASVLHLDLDAFFAAVEQRDKPSLRGKPVIVGGIGPRGVVSTASYEARTFGVHSAMPMHEARRRCPHAAFLSGRFGAYRAASGIVMGLLRELSPLVEPLSLDEAFVDLAVGERSLEPGAVLAEVAALKLRLAEATGGLTASVGVGSSKFIAKVATELAKPDGVRLVAPGTEVEVIAPLPARAIPGIGPVTMEKLARLGVSNVADLQRLSPRELVRELGRAQGEWIAALAFARDDRPVEPDRETKSISVEDTFETDVTDRMALDAVVERDATGVARRLSAAGLFARTITLKARYPDFTTLTRSRTLDGATDAAETIAAVARVLLDTIDVPRGLRLLGVGVAGLTESAQEALFELAPVEPGERSPVERGATPAVNPSGPDQLNQGEVENRASAGVEFVEDSGLTHTGVPTMARRPAGYRPGDDVVHDEQGAGWVWGTGLGRVTVRFETAETGPGPVRTFAVDDPALRPAQG
ncbi:DNA polymerase IV [Micropruina sonneratiae]|uniref:DNA polymerase IV n=1 Tax=Micropruina sonneratiae TaxID=2986940 RepID=UPI0022269A96|nr:DNA polymerase IV [Micropruina sp. KQZ13P-5]MCW3158185.1 DNA polymerase IV [Micropruina sp. KQZ13P-5]